MDAATLKRAVEPFFSTKGVGKGTGLGLSMVHGLAAQSGGALLLSSKPGSGTRAELWLPVADEKAAASEQTQAEAIPAARPSTVLLVDDEELVRIGTAEMLMDLGYSVVQASSGAEALGLLRRGEIEIDLLVSDYLMPGIGGAEFRARGAQAPTRLFRPFSSPATPISSRDPEPNCRGWQSRSGRRNSLPASPSSSRPHDRATTWYDCRVRGALVRTRANSKLPTFRIQRKSACPKTAL